MNTREKSLLATVNTGFVNPTSIATIAKKPTIVVPEKIKISTKPVEVKELAGLTTTVKTGYDSNIIQTVELIKPELITEHDDKPVISENLPEPTVGEASFPESVKDTIDIGYDGKIHKECPTPKFVTHLAKENYLGEFKEETEKQLARTNLGVYSKTEVNKIVSNIKADIGDTYVTKTEFNNTIITVLGVDSVLKSYVNYQIPETLFTL